MTDDLGGRMLWTRARARRGYFHNKQTNKTKMNDPKFTEAQKLFEQTKPAPSATYAKEQQAFHANRERLKAERLAREAANSQR